MEQVDVELLLKAFNQGGWLPVLGACLTLFMKIWSSDGLQNILSKFAPRWLCWYFWPDWARRLSLFFFAAIGGVITAAAGGMSWVEAAIKIVPVALMAHLFHAQEKLIEKKSSEGGII